MSVPDNQFSAQLLDKHGEAAKFDDIGCLANYLRDNGEVGEAYVRDFYTKEWIRSIEAIFIESQDLTTPMHSGVVSFQNEENAAKFLEETEGHKISWEDVLTNTKGQDNHES
jgi:copper chaperone NosL